jgi:hypothetical protein
MSIATTAPTKFQFQDSVAIELMLRFVQTNKLSIMIEPPRGEDLEIGLIAPTESLTIEVQVKGSNNRVTLERIAECLAHFTPLRYDQCLLDRLVGHPSHFVLLVMSGRCDDAASKFAAATEWMGEPHSNKTIRLKDAKALLEAFSRVNPPGGLKQKRRAYCKRRSFQITPRAFREAAKRLVILELMSPIVLNASLAEHLRTDYRVPPDRISDVINRLHDAVKRAKIAQTDAVPFLQGVLTEATERSLRPRGYIERGNENLWAATLSRTNVLLLSGPPRCGKSDAASRIAGEFQELGYDCRLGSDPEEAERYLRDSGGENRLFLLDDPLGGIHPSPEPVRMLSRLYSLVSHRTENQKLIIAQSQDQLFAVTGKTNLAACKLGPHNWHDLGSPPAPFLSRAWLGMFDLAVVDPARRNQISYFSDLLGRGTVSIEIGCLRHLASTLDEVAVTATSEQLLRKAHEDASDLGRALAAQNPDMQQLLIILAICSTPTETLGEKEVAFLGDQNDDSFPAKNDSLGKVIGGDSKDQSSFPTFKAGTVFSAKIAICVEQLERCQFIKAPTQKSIGFSHPFYRAAAEAFLQSPSMYTGAMTLRIVRRGLFCPAARTSRATARNLEWLFEAVNHTENQEKIMDAAIDGLDCLFPATRDICFSFLIRRFAHLPASKQRELSTWVNKATSSSLEEVKWQDGEPWIPQRRAFGDLWVVFARTRQPTERNKVEGEIAAISTKTPGSLSAEAAARILYRVSQYPEALTVEAATRFLTFDEAMVRAEATRVWVSVSRDDDGELLNLIFNDLHPNVAVGALKGTISAWWQLSEPRRDILINGLRQAISGMAVAAAFLPRLVRFDRVEYTGDNPPWPIFGYLLPTVLGSLPQTKNFIDDRLFSVMDSAAMALEAGVVVNICSEWITWLNRLLASGTLPSDFLLGVADILTKGTKREPNIRGELIKRLLQIPYTGPVLVFVGDLVDSWQYLRDDERSEVLSLLNGERSDQLWLKAVAVTRSEVPGDVQLAILRRIDRLSDKADILLETLPPDLLSAMISVYCGRPQPLWYLGKHHSRSAACKALIQTLQDRPEHFLFEIAFEEAEAFDEVSRIVDIIRNAGAKHADRLFDLMLHFEIRWNGKWLGEAWSALLDLVPDPARRANWMDMMAENAIAIIDNLGDLRYWLPRNEDRWELMKRLKANVEAVATVKRVSEVVQTGQRIEQNALLAKIELQIQQNSPRLFGTYGLIRDLLQESGIASEAFDAMLQKFRKAALAETERLEEEAENASEETALDEWISPKKT